MKKLMSKYHLIVASMLIFPSTVPASATSLQQKTNTLDYCYAVIGSKPRVDLKGCLQKQQQIAEKKLNKQFEKTRHSIEETGSYSIKEAISSLKKSQQAFLQFREAECKRVGDAAFGGSGASDMQRACITDLTYWRIRQLAE